MGLDAGVCSGGLDVGAGDGLIIDNGMDMKRFFKVFWPWLMVPVFWLVVGLLVMAMCGCARVQYVPVETVRVDSVHGTRWTADSVYLKDSILIELRTEQDTVYRTEYKYRTHWRERVVRDTLETVRVDSVPVPVPVERKLSRWEETKLHYGGFAFVAVVVCILAGLGRFVYRLKK